LQHRPEVFDNRNPTVDRPTARSAFCARLQEDSGALLNFSAMFPKNQSEFLDGVVTLGISLWP
jgi:hypothetical protein